MSSDEEYFPDPEEFSEEEFENNIVVVDKGFDVKELDPEDLIETVEEYELHEEIDVSTFEVNVEESPLIKNIRGTNFNEDEQIALEFCVDEMLTYSKKLSQELDEKIPMNWESVTQKMQDAGYDRTTKQLQNQYYKLPRREFVSQDNAIYQRLLRKLKEQMDDHEEKHRIATKIEASAIKYEEGSAFDDRDDDNNSFLETDQIIEEVVDDTHLDEKIKCNLCHVFVKRRDMFDHQSVHRNDAPYKCKECGKTFRKKYPLKLHRRVHTTDKPVSLRRNRWVLFKF